MLMVILFTYMTGYYNYHVCWPAGNATFEEGIPLVDTEWGYVDYDMCNRYKNPHIPGDNTTEPCVDGYFWLNEHFTPEVGTMVMEVEID